MLLFKWDLIFNFVLLTWKGLYFLVIYPYSAFRFVNWLDSLLRGGENEIFFNFQVNIIDIYLLSLFAKGQLSCSLGWLRGSWSTVFTVSSFMGNENKNSATWHNRGIVKVKRGYNFFFFNHENKCIDFFKLKYEIWVFC